MTFSGLKQWFALSLIYLLLANGEPTGRTYRVAHPHQQFPGVPKGLLGCSEPTTNTFFLPIKVSLRAACKKLQLNLY